MRFSQRMGLTPVKVELEKEGMSDELRNGLWSVFCDNFIDVFETARTPHSVEISFYKSLWKDFFKEPIDKVSSLRLTMWSRPAKESVREWYYQSTWAIAFDFIEFTINFLPGVSQIYNTVLKKEMSAYRFVEGSLIQINSEEEAVELETVLQNLGPTSPAREHLLQAMVLFSDRKNPDYRNSIKESISAVESLVKVLLEDEKATLGQALKRLEADHGLHPALKGAFDKLYGYTSDSGGIRHALKDGDVQVNAEEARFMLVTCSAFVNYLITKLN